MMRFRFPLSRVCAVLVLVLLATIAKGNDIALVSEVADEQIATEGAVVSVVQSEETLLRLEIAKRTEKYPSVLIHAPDGKWDLTGHQQIKATFRNIGEAKLTVEFWAVGAPGWDAPAVSLVLEPGEEKEGAIDLHQRWNGGLANKVDVGRIECLRVSLKNPPKDSRLEVSPIVLSGTASVEEIADDYERLEIPAMGDGDPAAGRRVKHQLPQHVGSELYHCLYLPTDWEPGKRYPIIFEYAGNRWLSAPCHSTGRPEGARMGYGMSKGEGYLWVSAPFVNSQDRTLALNGWGDVDATVEYAIELVKHLCENFGGDHSAVILTGFSRGAVACGFIGRHHDRISDVWLAFHPCQHYDGDGVHGANYEDALRERGPRIRGRATFHTDNGHHEKLRALFDKLGFPVVFEPSGIGAHTDTMFLENRPSTECLRKWLSDVVARKPGTYTVAGQVTDSEGNGIADVRIQSGETHVTFTDARGRFRLSGLISGNRLLRATKSGITEAQWLLLDGQDISDLKVSWQP